MKILDIKPSISNRVINAIEFNQSEYSYVIGLAPGAEITLTVPENAKLVRFVVGGGATVWVGTSTITIPASSQTITNQNAEPNPGQRILTPDITTLYFKSSTVGQIGVYFYSG